MFCLSIHSSVPLFTSNPENQLLLEKELALARVYTQAWASRGDQKHFLLTRESWEVPQLPMSSYGKEIISSLSSELEEELKVRTDLVNNLESARSQVNQANNKYATLLHEIFST